LVDGNFPIFYMDLGQRHNSPPDAEGGGPYGSNLAVWRNKTGFWSIGNIATRRTYVTQQDDKRPGGETGDWEHPAQVQGWNGPDTFMITDGNGEVCMPALR